MADPSSEKPDQPAAAEGRTPEDAAARLNEILSSPIEDPFAPEAKPSVPPDFAAWAGAKPSPEDAPDEAAAPRVEAASAEAGGAPPAAEPAPPPSPHGAPQGPSPDPNAAGVIAKVRRLMLISTVLTALAVAAVLGIIGYRLFHSEGSPPTQATLTLPPGAKIVQSAIADDRIVLTLQVGGALEIRTYDLKTLKPLGRLNFSTVP